MARLMSSQPVVSVNLRLFLKLCQYACDVALEAREVSHHRVPHLIQVYPGRLSYRHGLLQDTVANSLAQGTLTDNVHPSAKQGLKFAHHSRVVQQSHAWFEPHQEVNVAVRTGLTPRHRPEDTDIASTISLSDSQDVLALLSEKGPNIRL